MATGKKKQEKKQFAAGTDSNCNGNNCRQNFVSLLQELQEKEGYLSESSLKALAKQLDIPVVFLYGVATFYSQFRLSKPGKYRVSICSGTACHISDSAVLVKYAEELLGIKRGQKTLDGKISLETVNCLGACAKAPAMMINEEVFGELTRAKIKKILGDLE